MKKIVTHRFLQELTGRSWPVSNESVDQPLSSTPREETVRRLKELCGR